MLQDDFLFQQDKYINEVGNVTVLFAAHLTICPGIDPDFLSADLHQPDRPSSRICVSLVKELLLCCIVWQLLASIILFLLIQCATKMGYKPQLLSAYLGIHTNYSDISLTGSGKL